MKITFKYIYRIDQPYKSLEYNTESVDLDEILEDFEYFLRGVGFHFDGKIVISEEE